jgi:hypothetical protein
MDNQYTTLCLDCGYLLTFINFNDIRFRLSCTLLSETTGIAIDPVSSMILALKLHSVSLPIVSAGPLTTNLDRRSR